MSRSRSDLAEVVLCALALCAAVLGPALPRLQDHLLGIAAVDHFGTQWFYFFVDHALRTGGSLGRTDLLFHPWGKDLYLHTGANLLDALLCVPFRRLLGPVLGYNLFVLLGLAGTAWAFARLAREFVEDRAVAWIAGLLFAASPFVLYEAAEGRPTQAILALLPLVLLRAWRTGQRAGLAAPLTGGALLAILGYQYWYYAFFLGISLVSFGLWRVVRPPVGTGSRVAVLARFALFGGLALALVAPAALPILLRTETGGDVPGLLDLSGWARGGVRAVTAEGHAVALLTWQPWSGESAFLMQAADGAQRLVGHQRLGSWIWLALLGAAAWRPGRLDRGALLALALPAFLLAMGPLVLLGGVYLPNLPYIGLAGALGFLRRLWWPARAFAVLDLLALLALAVLLARWLPKELLRRRLSLAALLVAWLLGLHRAGLAPLPVWEAAVPAGYRCLAQGEPGAVIELPWGRSQAHLYYQGAHGRPMLGGMLERNPVFSPPEAVAFRQENTLVASLIAAAGAGEPPAGGVAPADVQAARDLGFRWVVFEREALMPRKDEDEGGDSAALRRGRRTRLRWIQADLRALLGPPVWADARTWIWPLPAAVGAVPESRQPPCAAAPVAGEGAPDDMIQITLESGCSTGSVRCLPTRPVRSIRSSGH
ncbi:MAG: hypothetical protein ABIO70_06690 [Pseudomonadota bacterium]